MSSNNDLVLLCEKRYGKVSISEALPIVYKRGQDAGAPLTDGSTALHWVAEAGNIELLQLLLLSSDIEIDVDARTVNGHTALFRATYTSQYAAMQLLLVRCANPDIADLSGMTPVHLCASLGHARALNLLLAAKAQAFQADGFGRTPLDYAKLNNNVECTIALSEPCPCLKEIAALDNLRKLCWAMIWRRDWEQQKVYHFIMKIRKKCAFIKNCTVCETGVLDTVLLPCRHLACCSNCAKFVTHCNLCTEPVSQKVEIDYNIIKPAQE